MNFLDRHRPDMVTMMSHVEWKTLKDGSMQVKSCKLADRVEAVYRERGKKILIDIGLVALCASVVGLAVIAWMAAVPIGIISGSALLLFWLEASVIFASGTMSAGCGIYFIGRIFRHVFNSPQIMKCRARPWLIDLLGRDKIKHLVAKSYGKTATSDSVYLQYQRWVGLKCVLKCNVSQNGRVDKFEETMDGNAFNILGNSVKRQILSDFYIHVQDKQGLIEEGRSEWRERRLRETEPNYLFVHDRFDRLIKGERIGLLNADGTESPVTEDSYVELC